MKRKKVVFILILLCIFSVIFFKIGKTYSKYNRSLKVQAMSKVAKPYLALEKNNILEVQNLNLDTFSYEFFVQNFEKEVVSETAFLYKIHFRFSDENAPIKLSLYRVFEDDEKKIELSENNSTLEFQKIGIQEEIAKYRVDVSYDLNSNEISRKDLEIYVDINAIQEEEENI